MDAIMGPRTRLEQGLLNALQDFEDLSQTYEINFQKGNRSRAEIRKEEKQIAVTAALLEKAARHWHQGSFTQLLKPPSSAWNFLNYIASRLASAASKAAMYGDRQIAIAFLPDPRKDEHLHLLRANRADTRLTR